MMEPGSGQPRRDNHFVAQGYLRGWTVTGERVWTYRVIVSRATVPPWRLHAIRSIAYRQHLYTHVDRGEATDRVERWLAEVIDAPSAIVLDKIAREERLAPADWRVLLRFFAASRVRTLGHLARRQQQWGQEIPKLIESTLQKTISRLEQRKRPEPRIAHPLGGDLVEPPI